MDRDMLMVRKQSLCFERLDEDLSLHILTEWHIKIKTYDDVHSLIAEHQPNTFLILKEAPCENLNKHKLQDG
jgi:hypothetical protein